MPCYDYRDDVRDTSRENMLSDQVARRDAMLCAFFRYFAKTNSVDQVLSALNYKKCGIDRASFEKWWELHQAEDAAKEKAAREKREAARVRRLKNKLRQELIANMTDEQLDLLGVKR